MEKKDQLNAEGRSTRKCALSLVVYKNINTQPEGSQSIKSQAPIMIMRWENCTVSFQVCVNEHILIRVHGQF